MSFVSKASSLCQLFLIARLHLDIYSFRTEVFLEGSLVQHEDQEKETHSKAHLAEASDQLSYVDRSC